MANKYLTNIKDLCLDDYICSMFSKYGVILIINSEDFKKLELDDFPTDYYFIVDDTTPSGQVYSIVDEELKRYFYEYCIKDSDKVFRGRKQR